MAKRTDTKKDLIVNELRMMIESGELPRGARIPQDDVASRFGTSITPVREALRQLHAEGLLDAEPHRPVQVADVNMQEVKGTYVARCLLEPYAAVRATLRISRNDLTRADELVAAMTQALQDQDGTSARVANREFHFLFYERCGLPALTRIIDGLWMAFPWDILQVVPGRLEQSIDEHREMVEACREGDAARVKDSFETHLRHSYLRLLEHLTNEPAAHDPFEVGVD